jgi:hypothetical protein
LALLGGNAYINIHSDTFPAGEIRGQIVDMVAEINGAQEPGGVASPGAGVGLFQIDTVNNALDYHILYGGLTSAETAAHIHGFALHGVNAGVLHVLPAANPKVGSWSYAEDQELGILEGRTYVNIHTMMFTGGEIRGQITRIVAPMDSSQEVPALAEDAHGCGLVALDTATDQLSYYMRHADLTGAATSAHIHGFAPPGAIAGVVHGIGTANPAIGTWTYGAANEANVLAGLTYFNVHTAAHPAGEIRGQVEFPPAPCPTDVDCDGQTGFGDLLKVLADWGPCPGCVADIDGDGTIGFNDLLLTLAEWGPC